MRRRLPALFSLFRIVAAAPRPCLLPVVAALVALALAGTVVDSDAARFRRGDRVRVGRDEIVNDDLYATGGHILIEGTVTGDLVAAGGEIVITGPVNGSVMVSGGRITIQGPVGGTVRAAGGRVSVRGTVGQDAVLAGGDIRLDSGATVRRDLVAAGGRISVADTVGDDAMLVGKHLRLEDGAEITSNLDYGSENALFVAPTAGVLGELRNHSGAWKMRSQNPQKRAILATWKWMRGVVGMFLLGVLFVVPFGSFARRTLDTLGASVFGSLLLGFAMVVILPMFAGLLLIFGVLAGGWWLGVFAFFFWLLAMLLGYVVGAIVIGRWTVARLGGSGVGLVWTLLFGVIVLGLIRMIPVLGMVVACAAMLLGLGALTITATRRPKRSEHPMAPRPEALSGP
jgi:hypothetical protein